MPYCYDYPRPAVTVDMVVFCLDAADLRVLMVRRKKDPYRGHWALPGGFLDMDEDIEAGALRELKEETGLEGIEHVSFLSVFGAPGRDPRGRTISLAHAAVLEGPPPRVKGGDDAARAAWLRPDEIEDFAFDHEHILETARRWLILGVGLGPVGLAFLPRTFDDSDVKRLFRAFGLSAKEATEWRKRLMEDEMIVKVPGKKARYKATDFAFEEEDFDDAL